MIRIQRHLILKFVYVWYVMQLQQKMTSNIILTPQLTAVTAPVFSVEWWSF